MEIAQTILEQLGGKRFMVMTGARNLVSLGKQEGILGGLSFKLPNRFATDGINRVGIYLTTADTYTVKFWKQKNRPSLDLVVVREYSDVYAEDLQGLFTMTTGLDTHL